MGKRIPIKAAKDVADKYNLKQVILCVWDGELTHVVTYGKTLEDCSQAACGGNNIKRALGWPEELCQAEPSRVKRKREHQHKKEQIKTNAEITDRERYLDEMKDKVDEMKSKVGKWNLGIPRFEYRDDKLSKEAGSLPTCEDANKGGCWWEGKKVRVIHEWYMTGTNDAVCRQCGVRAVLKANQEKDSDGPEMTTVGKGEVQKRSTKRGVR